VQLRLLAGGFTTMHDVMTHGLPWKFEPYNPNSGWRESQLQLLSEHFELMFNVPRAGDYLYSTSASLEGNSNGLWGLLRAYDPGQQSPIVPLASNPKPVSLPFTTPTVATGCDQGKPCRRKFGVTALTIQQLMGSAQAALIYNSRGLRLTSGFATGEQLTDPLAIIYVNNDDLCKPGSGDCVPGGLLKQGRTVEPLALRAAAGDVIELTLTNLLTGSETALTTPISGARPGMPYTNPFGQISLTPSSSVGLHPQLLAIDIRAEDGINAGNNPTSTVEPAPNGTLEPNKRVYTWYAGTITAGENGNPVATPVEFGAVNLQPSDPLNHAYRGLFGGLVVEPAGSTWAEDYGDHSSATVFTAGGTVFRDFVVNGQDDADILLNGSSNYQAGNALSAINYRTEPAIYRYGELLSSAITQASQPANWSSLQAGDLSTLGGIQWSAVDTKAYLSNSLAGGDPQTPIFRAPAGMPVRFRLLHAGGNGDNQQVFELSGHTWQAEPYINGSTAIGDNLRSPYYGVQSGYGVTSHYDVVIPRAGGAAGVAGDYVYRTWVADQFQVGFWGLFRVADTSGSAAGQFPDTVVVSDVSPVPGGNTVTARGYVTVNPASDRTKLGITDKVKLTADGQSSIVQVSPDGAWTATLTQPPSELQVASPFGGQAVWHGQPPRVPLAALAVQVPAVAAGSAVRRVGVRNHRHVGNQ
jgi:hypothetical protein